MLEYNPEWARSFFDEYGTREWERWDRSAVERVKFELHLHYLRKYLQPKSHILEIGAGPGRFTQELARLSRRIVVADLSPVQLQLNRANAQAMGFAGSIQSWVECDICHLHRHFHEAQFDAVVCYGGPLSYALDRRDQALAELRRVTRPGGRLLLSVMSLWGTLHHFLEAILKLDPAVNRDIIATGDLSPEKLGGPSQRMHMFRAAELCALLEAGGVSIEVLSASDCLSATWTECLSEAQEDPATWEHLLEMELEACREPGCLDMGTHLIAVCRRPG